MEYYFLLKVIFFIVKFVKRYDTIKGSLKTGDIILFSGSTELAR